MVLLLKLLISHFIGDFLLQPDKWAEEKEKNKLKSKYFYLHLLVHAVLLIAILWNDSLWLGILIILVSHALADYLKLVLQKERKRTWFFIDQGIHVAIILIVWFIYSSQVEFIDLKFDDNSLLILTGILFLVSPAAIIIKHVLMPWQPKEDNNAGNKNAGKYIGIIERLLVLAFILSCQWQAIGFLLAAKSVFRFKDIQKEEEVKITEYILLGTFLSFAFAIVTGALIKKLIG